MATPKRKRTPKKAAAKPAVTNPNATTTTATGKLTGKSRVRKSRARTSAATKPGSFVYSPDGLPLTGPLGSTVTMSWDQVQGCMQKLINKGGVLQALQQATKSSGGGARHRPSRAKGAGAATKPTTAAGKKLAAKTLKNIGTGGTGTTQQTM